MISQAKELGANAIISIRYDSSSLGGNTSGTEVFAMVLLLFFAK